jgi:hypothetical protein
MAQPLEPLPAWGAPLGSELQRMLPPLRDSFVNALLCFCSGLASSEGYLDHVVKLVPTTETAFQNALPKLLSTQQMLKVALRM